MKKSEVASQTVYVGTFTRPRSYLPHATGEGVYVLEFDPDSGELSTSAVIAGPENPAFVAVAPDGRSLHVAWEVGEWPEGLIGSYSVDPGTGAVSYLSVQGSRGVGPAYIATDSQSRLCLVANYMSGDVAALPLRSDGSLGEATSVIHHVGSGPNSGRQQGPHPHSMVVSPDDRFVFAADLGADRVFTYEIGYDDHELTPAGALAVPPGSGPRHLVFHSTGTHAYLTCELQSTILTLSYSSDIGTLAIVEEHSSLPTGYGGRSFGADVHIHPSGRWVYVSNRGHDSIATFYIEEDGRIELVAHRPSEGSTPRSFAVSPDGTHLLVANQDSDTVVSMRIDPKTGVPAETVSTLQVPTPVCVKFGRPSSLARESDVVHGLP